MRDAPLEAGANPHIVSGHVGSLLRTAGIYPPTTALAEAILNHHPLIVDILLSHMTSFSNIDIAVAAKEGEISVLDTFVKKGEDLNAPTGYGQLFPPPLFDAAEYGTLETVKWLIDHGADPNQVSQGQNPLERAIAGNQLENVRYLLQHGADPNIEYDDPVKPTALLVAIQAWAYFWGERKYADNLAIIDTLLLHGAKRNEKPSYKLWGLFGESRTPLEVMEDKLTEYRRYYDNDPTPAELKQVRLVDLKHIETIIERLKNGPSSVDRLEITGQ